MGHARTGLEVSRSENVKSAQGCGPATPSPRKGSRVLVATSSLWTCGSGMVFVAGQRRTPSVRRRQKGERFLDRPPNRGSESGVAGGPRDPARCQSRQRSRGGRLGTGTGTRTCCPFLGLEERHTDPPARRGCLVTARRLESISVPRSRSRELIGRSSSDMSRSCRSPRSDLPRPARFSVNTRRVQSFALWIIRCIPS
jgi:hypothetical protein